MGSLTHTLNEWGGKQNRARSHYRKQTIFIPKKVACPIIESNLCFVKKTKPSIFLGPFSSVAYQQIQVGWGFFRFLLTTVSLR